MGIVITLVLLITLLSLCIGVVGSDTALLNRAVARRAVALTALIAGLWNAVWYGAQHYTEFWGLVALASGLLLITAAVVRLRPERWRWLQILSSVLLLGFFLLYAITIIRINLGLPILS